MNILVAMGVGGVIYFTAAEVISLAACRPTRQGQRNAPKGPITRA